MPYQKKNKISILILISILLNLIISFNYTNQNSRISGDYLNQDEESFLNPQINSGTYEDPIFYDNTDGYQFSENTPDWESTAMSNGIWHNFNFTYNSSVNIYMVIKGIGSGFYGQDSGWNGHFKINGISIFQFDHYDNGAVTWFEGDGLIIHRNHSLWWGITPYLNEGNNVLSYFHGSAGQYAIWLKFQEIIPPTFFYHMKNWNNESSNSTLDAVQLDSNQNIYLAGKTGQFGAGYWDGLLIKIDAYGELVWNITWGGPLNDYFMWMVIDDNDDIFAVATTYNYGAGNRDIALIKYDSDGTLLWNVTYGTADHEVANSVDVDNNGFVYVGGENPTTLLPIIIKFNTSTGSQVWNNTYPQSGAYAGFRHLQVAENGDIYGTGTHGNQYDGFLLRVYSNNGTKRWQQDYGPSETYYGQRFVLDPSDNIYWMLHKAFGGGDGGDLDFIKYNEDGGYQGSGGIWKSAAEPEMQGGYHLSLGENQTAYTISFEQNIGVSTATYIRVFDKDLTFQNEYQIPSIDSFNVGAASTIDPENKSIYIVGVSYPNGGSQSPFLIKWNIDNLSSINEANSTVFKIGPGFNYVNLSNPDYPAYTTMSNQLIIDKNGVTHIVYTQTTASGYKEVFYSNNSPGFFIDSEILSEEGNSKDDMDPSFGYDATLDVIHVVWGTSASPPRQISYMNITNGIQGNITLLPLGPSTAHIYNPKIAVDTNSKVHIVGYGSPSGIEYEIYYINNTQGDFTSWFRVTNNGFYEYLAQIALDSFNNVHLTWYGNPSNQEIFYTNNTLGTFSSPVTVSSLGINSGNPYIVVDLNNVVHLAWFLVNSPFSIMYRNITAGVLGPLKTLTNNLIDYEHSPNLWYQDGKLHMIAGDNEIWYLSDILNDTVTITNLTETQMPYESRPSAYITNEGILHYMYKTNETGTTMVRFAQYNLQLETEDLNNWSYTWGNIEDGIEGWGGYQDQDGNIYVTGYGTMPGKSAPDTDTFLLKFSNSGELQWEKTWGGNQYDNQQKITGNSSGYLYTLGATESYGGGNQDINIMKYDFDGNLIWNKTWGGVGDEYGGDIYLGDDGYLYITGTSVSEGILLLKYDIDGNFQWYKNYKYADDDRGFGIALDSEANIYISGYIRVNPSPWRFDIIVLKFNQTGDLNWTRTWHKNDYERGTEIHIDTNDDLYICGLTGDVWSPTNALYLKYDKDGNEIWNTTWGFQTSWASKIKEYDNILYAVGAYDQGGSDYDGFLMTINKSTGVIVNWTLWGGGNYEDFGDIIIENDQNKYLIGRTSSYGYGSNMNALIGCINSSANDLGIPSTLYSLDTIDNTLPQIEGLNSDLNLEQLSTYNLEWNITEANNGSFIIKKNETVINSGAFFNWENITIQVNTTALGDWNYTIIATDPSNNNGTHSVLIHIIETVDPVIEIINYENDVLQGDETSFVWKVNESNPANYTIFQNGTLIDVGSYENDTEITYGPFLNYTIGDILFEIFINDTFGNNDSAQILISIIERTDDYVFLEPNATNYYTSINELGIYFEIETNDNIGFIKINRQNEIFPNIDAPADTITALFYYSFEIYDQNYSLNSGIINNAKIRLYYDPNKIGEVNNLILSKYKGNGEWEAIEFTLNSEDNYIEFTTSTFSIYVLGESKSDEPFPIIIIIIIIIGSILGVAIPALYIKSHKEKEEKKEKIEKKGEEKTEILDFDRAKEKREMLLRTLRIPEKEDVTPEIEPKRMVAPPPKKKKGKTEKLSSEISLEEKKRTAIEIEKTEKEMSIQPKEDVCQVHRGRIEGISYICPKCQTKYCLTCATTLAEKNESCWACEEVIKVGNRKTDEIITTKETVSVSKLEQLFEGTNVIDRLSKLDDINITAQLEDFLAQVEQFEWDGNDKEEFIKEMRSLTPNERENFFKRMKRIASSENKRDVVD